MRPYPAATRLMTRSSARSRTREMGAEAGRSYRSMRRRRASARRCKCAGSVRAHAAAEAQDAQRCEQAQRQGGEQAAEAAFLLGAAGVGGLARLIGRAAADPL